MLIINMKRRIIGILISILFLCYSFFAIENIEQSLPEPYIEEIYNWNVEYENNTDAYTFLNAKVNISNPPGKLSMDFIADCTSWKVYYNDIHIGKIAFKREKLTGDELDEKQEIERFQIDPDKKITKSLFVRIENDNLSMVMDEHIRNGERGELKIELTFSFEIPNLFIFWNISTNSSKILKTDILNKINKFKKDLEISKSFNRVLFGLSVFKGENNNLILINCTKFLFKCNKPFFDININDITWGETEHDNITTINQITAITGHKLPLRFLKLFLPENCTIISNNIVIGEIVIQKQDISKIRSWRDSRLWKMELYSGLLLDYEIIEDWIISHIKNNETSIFYIYPGDAMIDIFNESYPLNFSIPQISDILGKVDIPYSPPNWSQIRSIFDFIQYVIVIIISGICVYSLTDIVLTRKHRKKKK